MNTELYYFTGTGNGLHIAKSIKESLIQRNESIKLIPINTLDLSQNIYSNGHRVGIIFPTYAMSAPAIVKRFARKLHVPVQSYVFTYAHCGGGGTSGSTASIVDLLIDNGITVSNTFETTFPSNSTLFKYTDDKLDLTLAKSEISVNENVHLIVDRIQSIKTKSNALKRAFLKANGIFAIALENYFHFKIIEANDQCNGCSICSKVCPMENIEMKGQPQFKSNCETCFACINNCPQKALGFKKMNRKSFKPYKHPNVSLKELIYR